MNILRLLSLLLLCGTLQSCASDKHYDHNRGYGGRDVWGCMVWWQMRGYPSRADNDIERENVLEDIARTIVITERLCKSSLYKPMDQRPDDCIIAAYNEALMTYWVSKRIPVHHRYNPDDCCLDLAKGDIVQNNPKLAKAYERIKDEGKLASKSEARKLADAFLDRKIDLETYMKS